MLPQKPPGIWLDWLPFGCWASETPYFKCWYNFPFLFFDLYNSVWTPLGQEPYCLNSAKVVVWIVGCLFWAQHRHYIRFMKNVVTSFKIQPRENSKTLLHLEYSSLWKGWFRASNLHAFWIMLEELSWASCVCDINFVPDLSKKTLSWILKENWI